MIYFPIQKQITRSKLEASKKPAEREGLCVGRVKNVGLTQQYGVISTREKTTPRKSSITGV